MQLGSEHCRNPSLLDVPPLQGLSLWVTLTEFHRRQRYSSVLVYLSRKQLLRRLRFKSSRLIGSVFFLFGRSVRGDMEGLWRSLRVGPWQSVTGKVKSSELVERSLPTARSSSWSRLPPRISSTYSSGQNDRQKTAPQIEYRGSVFKALDLDESLRRAVRFATEAEDFGTTAELFSQIRILFERYIGLTSPESALSSVRVPDTSSRQERRGLEAEPRS